MPAKITKKGSRYQVRTPDMIHAKGTTKKKARSQVRLLNAIDHGYKPGKRRGLPLHVPGGRY